MNFDDIFKAYDIRGTYPDQIDEKKVKRIAQAFASFTGAKTVAVGRDVRLSGPKLQHAVIDGLKSAGVTVYDIGAVPTDMMYFAVGYKHFDGGIQVSASHNPAEFNGLKMVRAGVEALSSDNGLNEIKALAESDRQLEASMEGRVDAINLEEDYLDYLTKFVQFSPELKLNIVANNNFGLSGHLAAKMLDRLKADNIQFIELNWPSDGSFPKGRPDPLIAENRAETSQLIKTTDADLAVAWDADGDRCYFADENGEFVEGCHLTALLALYLLEQEPKQKIIYDPRNIWAVIETVKNAGGEPVLNKAGHTFIKNRMRSENALFAGEMSGHFYFREFYDADNGIIPFLLILNIIDAAKQPLSKIIEPWRKQYFVSGEINFTVADKDVALKEVESIYSEGQIDRTDGLSIQFEDWRFNLRPSNTENLLRLNVETKDQALIAVKTKELVGLLKSKSA